MGELSKALAQEVKTQESKLRHEMATMSYDEVVDYIRHFHTRESHKLDSDTFNRKTIITFILNKEQPENIIKFAKDSQIAFDALKTIVKQSFKEDEALVPQRLRDLLLLELLSDNPGPKKNIGRPSKSTRDMQIANYIRIFSSLAPLRKGTGENTSNEDTLVDVLSEVFRVETGVIRDAWKRYGKN